MTETLCWTCKRAGTSTCSWDAKLEPVGGWTAEKQTKTWKSGKNGCYTMEVESYCVMECPLHIPDDMEGRQKVFEMEHINSTPADLAELLDDGLPISKCADILGVSDGTVYNWKKRLEDGKQ